MEKDGAELEEEAENQNAQDLEALAIAQRIQGMVGREEIVDKKTGKYRPVSMGIL